MALHSQLFLILMPNLAHKALHDNRFASPSTSQPLMRNNY